MAVFIEETLVVLVYLEGKFAESNKLVSRSMATLPVADAPRSLQTPIKQAKGLRD